MTISAFSQWSVTPALNVDVADFPLGENQTYPPMVNDIVRNMMAQLKAGVTPGLANVDDFGAVGNGVTDDSAAFVAALATGKRVTASRGKIYVAKDVTINGGIVDLDGARVKVAAGAKYAFRLTGFGPYLENFEIDDTSAGVVKSTTLGGNVLAAATSFTVASATGLEIGQVATVLMDNGRWHCSIITNIVTTTVTIARAFEDAATSGAAVACSWGMVNVRGASRATLSNGFLLNASFGIVSDAPTGLTYINTRTFLRDVRIEDVGHIGMFVGRDCADSDYANVQIRGGKVNTNNFVGDGVTDTFTLTVAVWRKSDLTVTVAGVAKTAGTHFNFTDTTHIQFTGGNIPSAAQAIVASNFYDGKSGLVIDSTGFSSIRGGDQFSNITALDFVRGVELHAKELSTFDHIISDTISGEALLIDACTSVVGVLAFDDTFLGFAHRALEVTGSSVGLIFNGPTYTFLAATVEMVTGAVASTATAVGSGSTLHINAPGWVPNSNKTSSGSGFLVCPGSTVLRFADNDQVVAGATVYYGPDGWNTAQRSSAIIERPMRIKRFVALNQVEPGGGESYTYTVRINAVDTAVTGAITGTGVFSLDLTHLDVGVAKNTSIDVKVVASGGAASSAQRFMIELV